MTASDKGPEGESSSAPAGLDLGLTPEQRELFNELELLMALNTPIDRSTAELPALRRFAGAGDGSRDLIDLVHHAAQALSDPQRDALAHLFPREFTAESGNLTGRKRRAAGKLGKPYNTARARRDGQPNDFDRLLAEVARAIDSVSVGSSESGGSSSAAGRDAGPGRGSLLSSAMVGVGAAVVVLLAVVGLFLINVESGNGQQSAGATDPTSSTTSVATTLVPPTVAPSTITDPAAPRDGVATPSAVGQAVLGRIPDCDRPIGGPLVPADDSVWIAQPMIDAYKAVEAGGFDLACPNATAQSWGEAWYQTIDGADVGQAGTIVAWGGPGSTEATDDGPTAVFLPRTIWLAYWNAGLSDGKLSQSLAGFPLDFIVDDEGHWISHMSHGDLIITEQSNVSGRWIPNRAVPVWESHGGVHGDLGLPMTNVEYVDGLVTQTYERGKVFADTDGSVVSEVYDQATIDAAVAALPRATNGILSTYDSTDWFIDDTGVRHWIPSGPDHDDGALWECLGGLDNTIAEGLNGWVIAAFPLGENATCDAS